LLVATVPLWLIVIDRIFNGARIGLSALAGLIAGVVGVGFLAGPFGGGAGHAAAGSRGHRRLTRNRHRDHPHS
jgi:drug/metabolite transporter (DMT)-like permease